MLAINAGPRKGSRRANQFFLLLPESTACASRVVASVLDSLILDGFEGFFDDGMYTILL
jgi:hypothetical protein